MMLQHPSKYQSNPLSHFLALRNVVNSGHHHIKSQFEQISDCFNNSEENSSTSVIDTGKSFTIAAILGLKKNASRGGVRSKDPYHTHSHQDDEHQEHCSQSQLRPDTENSHLDGFDPNHQIQHHQQRRESPLTPTVGGVGSSSCVSSALSVFDCDKIKSSVINHYVSTKMISDAANKAKGVVGVDLVNNFEAANSAVLALSGIGSGASSALQNIHQQLHQQQQNQHRTAFKFTTRDKNSKTDFLAKRSSIKNKRVRTIFTPEQLERLEAEFERQQYMVGPERLYLAHTLQLTEAQVKVWFQNRRIKWRKHHLEVTHQRLALIHQKNGGSTLKTPEEHQHQSTPDDLSINNSNPINFQIVENSHHLICAGSSSIAEHSPLADSILQQRQQKKEN